MPSAAEICTRAQHRRNRCGSEHRTWLARRGATLRDGGQAAAVVSERQATGKPSSVSPGAHLLEAVHHAAVSCRIKLHARLHHVHRHHAAVGGRAAQAAGEATLEVVRQVVHGLLVRAVSNEPGPLHGARSHELHRGGGDAGVTEWHCAGAPIPAGGGAGRVRQGARHYPGVERAARCGVPSREESRLVPTQREPLAGRAAKTPGARGPGRGGGTMGREGRAAICAPRVKG